MTESNQGPATPGTAARCERCGRIKWRHDNPVEDGFIIGCLRDPTCTNLYIERLKAENASLRANVDQLVGDVQAVTQDYTNAAGALRWIADWDKQPAMMQVARTLHYDMAAKARAALSGEEAAGASKTPSDSESLPARASLRADLAIREEWLADFRKSLTATEEARASLLESLREAEKTSEKRLTELTKYYEAHGKECLRAAAAEQRAEAAEKEIGEWEHEGIAAEKRYADLMELVCDLLNYRRHRSDCAIDATDFCTCGLREVAVRARAALHDEERPTDLMPVPATAFDVLKLSLERTPKELRAALENQMRRADANGTSAYHLKEALQKIADARLPHWSADVAREAIEKWWPAKIPDPATLHDEERSAPPGPVECMPPYTPHAMVGEDCCRAFPDHMKDPPTAGECCKHHGAAAQGEER